ncbi:protein bfr2-like [Salvia miltiorrhiza]|uniref:protein bfr2-like n=1 Tax=Salvia miltiorrhiza TaxID=226208 RepID=UPI0025ACE64B|nr:protein bfr2-like [Salvia miltiorrhiza]
MDSRISRRSGPTSLWDDFYALEKMQIMQEAVDQGETSTLALAGHNVTVTEEIEDEQHTDKNVALKQRNLRLKGDTKDAQHSKTAADDNVTLVGTFNWFSEDTEETSEEEEDEVDDATEDEDIMEKTSTEDIDTRRNLIETNVPTVDMTTEDIPTETRKMIDADLPTKADLSKATPTNSTSTNDQPSSVEKHQGDKGSTETDQNPTKVSSSTSAATKEMPTTEGEFISSKATTPFKTTKKSYMEKLILAQQQHIKDFRRQLEERTAYAAQQVRRLRRVEILIEDLFRDSAKRTEANQRKLEKYMEINAQLSHLRHKITSFISEQDVNQSVRNALHAFTVQEMLPMQKRLQSLERSVNEIQSTTDHANTSNA